MSAAKRNRRSPALEPPAPATPHAVRLLAPLLLLLFTVGIAAAWWWFTAAKAPPSPPAVQTTASVAPQPASYVDNQQCLGCHAAAAAQWKPSQHAMAMALPNAQTHAWHRTNDRRLTVP